MINRDIHIIQATIDHYFHSGYFIQDPGKVYLYWIQTNNRSFAPPRAGWCGLSMDILQPCIKLLSFLQNN